MTTRYTQSQLWPLSDYEERLRLESIQSRIDARRIARKRRQRVRHKLICVLCFIWCAGILGWVMFSVLVAK
jgi:hypothetical protein